MSKSKGVVLGAGYGHINRVGPTGAFIGDSEGYSPGKPKGYTETVADQYNSRGVGIDTRVPPQHGTPYNDVRGNPDEYRRVASQHRYGVVLGERGQDMNNPASNGDGVILDHMKVDYANPKAAPTVDSPVRTTAPVFDTLEQVAINEARLGRGVKADHAIDDLIGCGGVMSQDFESTSKYKGK
jgi:hypothetical protein